MPPAARKKAAKRPVPPRQPGQARPAPQPFFGDFLEAQRVRGEARKARKAAVGQTVQQGIHAAREAAQRKMFQGRLMREVERMRLNRAIPAEDFRVLQNLAFELGLKPRQAAETLHAIYTEPRTRQAIQQAIALNRQNPNDWNAFNQLAGSFVDVAVRKRIINPMAYR